MANINVDNVTVFVNKVSHKVADICQLAVSYEKRINSDRTALTVQKLLAATWFGSDQKTDQGEFANEATRQNKKKRKIDDDSQDGSLKAIVNKADLKGFLQPLEMLKQVHLSISQRQVSRDPTCLDFKEAQDLKNYLNKLDNIPVIKSAFGLCCTQYQTTKARPLACGGYECGYLIDVGAVCWERISCDGIKVIICTSCYSSIKRGQIVSTQYKHRSSNELIRVDIPKVEFLRKRTSSDAVDEPTVTCSFCRRLHHKMCVMYDSYNWAAGYSKFCHAFSERLRPLYVCNGCMNQLQGEEISHNLQSRIKFQFHPVDLKLTRLSQRLEESLENSVSENVKNSMKLFVREVSRRKNILIAKPNMRKVYIKNGREFKWEYLQRSIMLFQEQRGSEYPIAVFNMIVYEYPSTKTVCLSYIDSVKLFQPESIRRGVFQNTILIYMDDARERGYTKFHFWACPPKPGDEYVFYGRPEEKRSSTPVEGGLIRWYKEMLNKAKEKDIIEGYFQVCENTYTNYLDIPYLLDDFWPAKLETILSSYSKEVYNSTGAMVDRSRSMTKSRKSANGGLLCVQERVVAAIRDECPGTLFCVNLKPPNEICTSDDESDIFCPYMGNRDNFIIECRDRKFDFSTERRARYSTMIMLSRIAKHSYNTCCNLCEKNIKKGLHCYKCPNIVFCSENCANVHSHKRSFRRFETPLRGNKINPNPIFAQILKHIVTEATFLTELAYELFSPKSSCAKFRNSVANAIKQHLELLNSAVHQQEETDCRVCGFIYLAIMRHKEFCRASVCNVPSCTFNLCKKRWDNF